MRLDETELVRWGNHIGQTIEAPAFIGLSGELGAGKSVLARAIGSGAGVITHMPSPSYTLVQRYPAHAGRTLVHLDLYRIKSPDDLWELGWSQLADGDEIVLVEWPARAGSLLPEDRWLIELVCPVGLPEMRDVEVWRIGSPPEVAQFSMVPSD